MGAAGRQSPTTGKRPARPQGSLYCLVIGRWCPRCSHFDWRSSASWCATVPHSKLRRARRRPPPRRRRPRRRRRAPRRRRRNTHPSLLAGRQRRRHRRCRYATARNAKLALSLEHPCRQLCNAAASVWSTPPSAPATSPKQALVHFARISPRGSCAVAVTNAAPRMMLITAPSKALRASTSIFASLA